MRLLSFMVSSFTTENEFSMSDSYLNALLVVMVLFVLSNGEVFAQCSKGDVYLKERDYLLSDSVVSNFSLFGTSVVLPQRYRFKLERDSFGLNVIQGDYLIGENDFYLGCPVIDSYYGIALYGPVGKCGLCEKGEVDGVELEKLFNKQQDGISADVFLLEGEGVEKSYQAVFYDGEYFLSVLDGNPYFFSYLLHKLFGIEQPEFIK